jgi:O-antigen/teichoic acid export membrane protein
MNLTSTKARFSTTVVANVLRMSISFVTGLVIARVLGPKEYGNFYFLLGSFTALIALVNMASSSAFYTFISQKQRGRAFFFYYLLWILIQFGLLLLLVLLLPNSLKGKIWLGHSRDLVLLALFVSFNMHQIWGCVGGIGESIRDTVGVQIRNIALAMAYFVCVLLIAGFHLMSVGNLFILNSFLYFVFAIQYGWHLYRIGNYSHVKTENLVDILGEYKVYCLPLIIYTCFAFLYHFADYWLLQRFGGSIQQGYYAVGARFSAISLVATTSMVKVLWKEVAEAQASGNVERVRKLYQGIVYGLYFLSAISSCFLILFSKDILFLFLGPAYQDAWLPLSLMFLYPIHQSMGQITGTMLMATGKTKIKSYTGLLFMAISILITYFVLAPKDSIIPGLYMGALGLSLKMVLANIFIVNLTAYFVAKSLNISFGWCHQIIVLALLIPLGFLSKLFSQWVLYLLSLSHNTVLLMVLSGIIYSGVLIVIVYYFPSIAGIKRSQINRGIAWINGRLNLV